MEIPCRKLPPREKNLDCGAKLTSLFVLGAAQPHERSRSECARASGKHLRHSALILNSWNMWQVRPTILTDWRDASARGRWTMCFFWRPVIKATPRLCRVAGWPHFGTGGRRCGLSEKPEVVLATSGTDCEGGCEPAEGFCAESSDRP